MKSGQIMSISVGSQNTFSCPIVIQNKLELDPLSFSWTSKTHDSINKLDRFSISIQGSDHRIQLEVWLGTLSWWEAPILIKSADD